MEMTCNTIFFRPCRVAAWASLALVAGACSSDDDDGQTPETPTFEAFVLEQFDATADDTEPVPINDRSFTFGEDPSIFGGLFE